MESSQRIFTFDTIAFAWLSFTSIWARFMWKNLPAYPKSQRGIIRLWLITLVIGLALFAGFSLFSDVFFVSLVFLIPIGLLALFFGGMRHLIRKTYRRPTTPSISRDVGWLLFGSCGILCALTGMIIFPFTCGGSSEPLYWNITIFFGLPYLLACLGLIQIIGGMPFTRIPRNWNTLGAARRLSLVTIITGALCMLFLCVYFLDELRII